LYKAIRDKHLTIVEAVKWVADHGAEHIEIVPAGFDLKQNPELIDAIKRAANEAGIEISNYAVGNNFITDSDEEFQARIAELKEQVDIAAKLGVKFMRHDVASVPPAENTIHRFEQELPKLAEGCRIIADYAAQYGITTSVENHGYFIQAADRVQRLVQVVERPNFRTTLDVGNFMCADENSVASVKKNLPIASVVHLKDFYWRPAWMEMGEGWFRTASGNYLRGAITGYGDIDLRSVLREIKSFGFDGYISIEFEGMEECREASRISLDNVRKLWNAV
jgi:sugar phosphate isomerase/epimerase